MFGLPVALEFVMLAFVGAVGREQARVIAHLQEEVRVLRSMVPGRPLFSDAQRKRLARSGERLGRSGLTKYGQLVHPDTILRWYRELIRRKYEARSDHPRPGRPRLCSDVANMIVRMARENPGWGYVRISGELKKVGMTAGPTTVRRYLAREGLDPARNRQSESPWKQFMAAHFGALAQTDFFTVEVLTLQGLVRYAVLFVIDASSRRVEIVGMVHEPFEAWMLQMARKLTDAVDGWLTGFRVLTHDRDRLFTRRFREMLEAAGVTCVRLPPKSPNLNAYAERFVRSVRQECLRHVVPLGETHLRVVLREYLEHYNHDRPHQGIGNRRIDPPPDPPGSSDRPIECRERLGGIVKSYGRKAA